MKANSPAVLHALDAIFDTHAQPQADGTVKVVLEKEVSHAQCSDLIGLCQYLGNAPRIARSGAGVTVEFAY